MKGRNIHIENSAEWLTKYKYKKRLAGVLITLAIIILVFIYVIAYLFNSYGSFTISIKKFEMISYGLTLSESTKKYNQVSRLNAVPLKEACESTADWIDEIKELNTTDGSHNGENYLAYTFYLINSSDNYLINYKYDVSIRNSTLGIEEAVRIKLFVNDEDLGIYGKQEKDGATPLRNYEYNRTYDLVNNKYIYDRSEKNLINKFSSSTILTGEIEKLQPHGYTKFTIVMWIEGTDPECNNDISGGIIRLDMSMSVTSALEIEK